MATPWARFAGFTVNPLSCGGFYPSFYKLGLPSFILRPLFTSALPMLRSDDRRIFASFAGASIRVACSSTLPLSSGMRNR